MKVNQPRLLFVYNAESGFFDKLTDMVHKILSPGTYACSLCSITYGKFSMHEEWATFLKGLPLEVDIIYRNDWKSRSVCDTYPLVALQKGDHHIEVLLRAQELNQMQSLTELKNRLEEALQKVNC